MSDTITLSRGPTTVTLPIPERLRADRDGTELEFRFLTSAEKESLATFFKETARGTLETWTYTDPSGTEHAARFAEPALVFVQFAGDDWDVSAKITWLDGGAQ